MANNIPNFLENYTAGVPQVSVDARPVDPTAPLRQGANEFLGVFDHLNQQVLESERKVKLAQANAALQVKAAETVEEAKALKDPALIGPYIHEHMTEFGQSLTANESDPRVAERLGIDAEHYRAQAVVVGGSIRFAKARDALDATIKAGSLGVVNEMAAARGLPNHEGIFEAGKQKIQAMFNSGVGMLYSSKEDADLAAKSYVNEAFTETVFGLLNDGKIDEAQSLVDKTGQEYGITQQHIASFNAHIVTEQNRRYETQQRDDRMMSHTIESQIMLSLLKDKNSDVSGLLAQGTIYDPHMPARVMAFKRENIHATDDPLVFSRLMNDVYEQPNTIGPRQITEAYVAGDITKASVDTLLSRWEVQRGREADPRLRDPIVKSLHDGVEHSIYNPFTDKFDQFKAINAAQFSSDYYLMMDDYLTSNPTASIGKVREEAQRVFDVLVKRATDRGFTIGKAPIGPAAKDPSFAPANMQAALRGDGSVDPMVRPLFSTDQELRAAVDQLKGSHSGPLVELAKRNGWTTADVNSFLAAQKRLIGKPKATP